MNWLSYPGRDWPEDFSNENGNYMNTCCTCSQPFIGHKRRYECKECVDKWTEWFAGLTPEERRAHEERVRVAAQEMINALDKPQ